MSHWLQITLRLPGHQADAAEQLLQAAGSLSVTWLDAQDQPLLEPAPGEQPVWDEVVLKGLFPAETPLNALQQACEQLPGCRWLGMERLEDRAWERAWMDRFAPMRFGQRLWIVPTSHPVPDDAQVVLRLDPGLAFGTGTHATTSLCLQWLDAHPPRGAVLDYGCGSGVLALAALLLGADHATGVDIDPQALEASRDNAQRNGLHNRLALYAPENLPASQFPLVLAKILAEPLCQLAAELAGRVRPGGHLVLSGILAEQAHTVRQAYDRHLQFQQQHQQDDWVRLVFTRP